MDEKVLKVLQNNGTFEKTSGADEGRVTQSKASELQLHLDLE